MNCRPGERVLLETVEKEGIKSTSDASEKMELARKAALNTISQKRKAITIRQPGHYLGAALSSTNLMASISPDAGFTPPITYRNLSVPMLIIAPS